MPSISQICPFLVQKAQNPSKFLPKPFPNRPKTLPKRPKIHPKGLLEPILDQCFNKIRFWTSKKPPKCAQKWPQGGPERPKPFPNWAQDLPKSDFCAFFCVFFLLIVNVHRFFINIFAKFTCFFKSRRSKFVCPRSVVLIFVQITIFQQDAKYHPKINSKPCQNQLKINKGRFRT